MFGNYFGLRQFGLPGVVFSLLLVTGPVQAAPFGSPDVNWMPQLGDTGRPGSAGVNAAIASKLLREQAEISTLAGLKVEDGVLAAVLVAVKRAIEGDVSGAQAALAAAGDTELPDGEREIAQALILRGQGHFDNAVRLLDELLIKDPKNAYAHNLRGTISFRVDGPDAALPHFTKAAQAGPNGATFWANLAAVLFETGQRDTGRRALAHAVSLSPDTCSTLLALANIETEEGNHRSAAERFAGCLQAEPDRADAATGLVTAYLQNGEHEKARETFRQYRGQINNSDTLNVEMFLRVGDLTRAKQDFGIIPQQDSAEVQVVRGRLNLALGDERTAREAFERALELSSRAAVAATGLKAISLAQGEASAGPATGGQFRDVDAIFNALDLLAQGETDTAAISKAFSDGQGAITGFRVDGLTPDDLVADMPPEAAKGLAVPLFLMMTKTNGRAVEMLTELSEAHPSSAILHLLLAQAIVVERGSIEAAYKALDTALAQSENFLAAHLMRAELAFRSGDFKSALNSFKAASKISSDPQTHMWTGVLAEQLGEYDVAETALRRFADLAPDNFVALNQLAWFLVNQRGDDAALDEGEALATKALKLRPGNAAILDTLGWVAYKRGDLETALAKLQQAVDVDQGQSPEITLHFAQVSIEAGRMEQAREVLRPLFNDMENNPMRDQIAALAEQAELR